MLFGLKEVWYASTHLFFYLKSVGFTFSLILKKTINQYITFYFFDVTIIFIQVLNKICIFTLLLILQKQKCYGSNESY